MSLARSPDDEIGNLRSSMMTLQPIRVSPEGLHAFVFVAAWIHVKNELCHHVSE